MTYGHLQADCLYTGISSGPKAGYRVWGTFTFLPFYGKRRKAQTICLPFIFHEHGRHESVLLAVIPFTFMHTHARSPSHTEVVRYFPIKRDAITSMMRWRCFITAPYTW